MSEIEITQADREAASQALRFVADVHPMECRDMRAGRSDKHWLVYVLSKHRHEARAEALEAAAKAIERIATPLRAEGKRLGAEGDLEGAALRIMQFDGANAALEATRALRSGEREG